MQTAVNDKPYEVYEGMVAFPNTYPNSIESKATTELMYFGKFAAVDFATIGAAPEDQTINAPTAAADITGQGNIAGVLIADTTLERLSVAGAPAAYGAYVDESMAGVMRKGQIWVVVDTAITDLTVGVYVRWQNAGGTPPTEALGSFDSVTSADHALAPAAHFQWKAARTVNGVNYGLLAVDLP